ncbi:heavy metal translocating P-type ATPase [Paracoccus sp. 1_MG-2023]|uniref:heavy metal translocating P-type ATPase n=1 Tax=unclassified Paracoccus (in: a-proteobacteria) TaxID=2688777 RepID=UPI001C086389|nr:MULTISPECIES: heavy metal translocating P-type ATPase [unclassified Paracoccus (in: a-proteobacteria)]MBU2957100.1 cadmium-translocating P-type ATPase [Paracoccus sp. C2R09]MDO6669566.1 heavy metal translocating P-type ATPase [Paracoccus sp. 1_MG-2023]
MTSTTEIELPVPGISCAGCATRVGRALDGVPGIASQSVNPMTRSARIGLGQASLSDIRRALDDAGYPAQLQTTRLSIEGMSCASCAGRVTRALQDRPEIAEAQVNLATHQAVITHAPSLDPAALAGIVTDLGYPARPAADHADIPEDEAAPLARDALLAALLTLPIFVTEMGGHVFPGFHDWLHGLVPMRMLWVAQMLLAFAVLAIPGRRFFRAGIPALLRGAPEMNSLVALGSGAAFAFSTVVTLAPQIVPEASRAVWFEAAAVIVTLILTGRWLEARARGQAGQAIRALVSLRPDSVTLIRDGQPRQVPVETLVPGDLLQLAPGERVALDGELVEGRGDLDESMLTGEALPVSKSPGDRLIGGTMNGRTALTYRVTATGQDTVLSRIVQMVADAQSARLPVQALVDRVTRVFVPAVIGLSVLTFLLWLAFGPGLAHAVVAAVAVLIIACPCAMGLAVPVGIMVGGGRAAQLGILFRRGDALQRLADAQIVAFDKTGTLTEGKPRLTGILTDGIDRSEALRLAAAAEARSEHPLAAAILAAHDGPLPEASEVEATPGRGLQALVEGRRILLGNAAALRDAGIAPLPALAGSDEGTEVLLAIDGRHMATLSLADREREGAKAAIAALHEMGVRTAILSGDRPQTARAVADRLGIDRVEAGLLPEDKLRLIGELGEGGVFVGDGINDAPALAAAPTGIAIGTGTDIAIEAADAVLISGEPEGVARAIRLSRAVMRNIRQNLFWAFAYNVALIPVAMGVLVPFGGPQLSPMLGAGAMALSSVFVITNALRLRSAA